jgi:acyl-CoA synthetase (AMP-forming)/AMP-acid ligase II
MAGAFEPFNRRRAGDPWSRERRRSTADNGWTAVLSHPLISRRNLLIGIPALTLLRPTGAGAALEPPSGPVRFRALRNGNPIGTHTLSFTEDGGRLIVDIEIKFAVKFAFITLYSYHHTNRETWQDGRLVAIETRTDDDGDEFRVSGRAVGNTLEIDGSSGKLTLPGDTVPSSYWNEAMATRGEWLDTQAGKLARSTVKQQPDETVEVAGQGVQAKRYALVGDITCDLWFHDGEWVKLLFTGEDGSVIDYLRMA